MSGGFKQAAEQRGVIKDLNDGYYKTALQQVKVREIRGEPTFLAQVAPFLDADDDTSPPLVSHQQTNFVGVVGDEIPPELNNDNDRWKYFQALNQMHILMSVLDPDNVPAMPKWEGKTPYFRGEEISKEEVENAKAEAYEAAYEAASRIAQEAMESGGEVHVNGAAGTIIPTRIKGYVRKSGDRAGEKGYNISFLRALPRGKTFIAADEVFSD